MSDIKSKSGRSKDVRRIYHRDVPAENQTEIDATKRYNKDADANKQRTVPTAYRATPMKVWARDTVRSTVAALSRTPEQVEAAGLVRSWLADKGVRS